MSVARYCKLLTVGGTQMPLMSVSTGDRTQQSDWYGVVWLVEEGIGL